MKVGWWAKLFEAQPKIESLTYKQHVTQILFSLPIISKMLKLKNKKNLIKNFFLFFFIFLTLVSVWNWDTEIYNFLKLSLLASSFIHIIFYTKRALFSCVQESNFYIGVFLNFADIFIGMFRILVLSYILLFASP